MARGITKGGGKGFTMKITGVQDIIRNLELTKRQKDRVQKFLEDESNTLIKVARETVPVDTSRLKDSHRMLTGGSKKGFIKADVVAGGISIRGRFVHYAEAVHEGDPKGRGIARTSRPWLRMAFEKTNKGYTIRLAKVIKIHKSKRSPSVRR